MLWHFRLVHVSWIKMKHITKINASEVLQPCNVCPLSKQHRLVFPNSNTCEKHVFGLLHADIWGPYHKASLSGARYILTIVDDYSRALWTILLQSKAQVSTAIQELVKQLEKQSGEKVKKLRSDNGLEFVGNDCQKFFAEKGIIHQKSCAYTTQQNGVIERKHRHLLKVARALPFQSGVPTDYWGEAITAAIHIINLLPVKSLGWESPFKRLHKREADYSHLKSFGCKCFYTNLIPHKDKLAERATEGVLIGYPAGQKGYKVLNPVTRKIIVTREVVF